MVCRSRRQGEGGAAGLNALERFLPSRPLLQQARRSLALSLSLSLFGSCLSLPLSPSLSLSLPLSPSLSLPLSTSLSQYCTRCCKRLTNISKSKKKMKEREEEKLPPDKKRKKMSPTIAHSFLPLLWLEKTGQISALEVLIQFTYKKRVLQGNANVLELTYLVYKPPW